MDNRRRLAVAIALAATLAGGGVVLHRSLNERAVSAARGAQAPRLRLQMAQGDEWAYRFAVTSEGVIDTQGVLSATPGAPAASPPAKPQTFSSRLSGRFLLQALEVKSSPAGAVTRALLRFRGMDAVTTVDGNRVASGAASSDFEGLAVAVELTDRGAVQSIRIPEGTPITVRAAVRHFLSLARVTFPAEAESSYDALEEGVTAPWQAHYQFKSDGHFTKSTKVDARQQAGKREVGEGAYEGLVDLTTGGLRLLKGSLRKSTRVGSHSLESETTTLNVELEGTRSLSSNEINELRRVAVRLAERPAGTLSASSDFEDQDQNFKRKLVANESIEGLISRTSIAGKMTAREMHTLSAFFALDPKSAEQATPLLMQHGMHDDRFQSVAVALAMAGTKESQAVLRRAASTRSGDSEVYASLLGHLAESVNPTTETEAALRQARTKDDRPFVRQMATLSMGTLAHRLREHEPERAQRIVDETVAELRNAKSDAEVLNALGALGNVGLESQVTAIRPHLSSANEEVRRAAVWALRFVESEEAAELLLAAAQNDLSEHVRSTALQALGFTDPSTAKVSALRTIIARETHVRVVADALRLLGRQAEVYAEAAEELRRFGKTCGNRDLCAIAEQLIARLS